MRNYLSKAALLLALSASFLLSHAQSVELGLEMFTSTVVSQTNTLLTNNAVEAATRHASSSGRSEAAASARTERTTYVPTPAARQQAIRTQSTSMKQSAALAQQFAATFGPGGPSDYVALYRQLITGTGLRDNDVADAYAAYLLATYQVAHGASSLVPAASARRRGLCETSLRPPSPGPRPASRRLR